MIGTQKPQEVLGGRFERRMAEQRLISAYGLENLENEINAVGNKWGQ